MDTNKLPIYIDTAAGLVKLGLVAAEGIKALFSDPNSEADAVGMQALDLEIHRRQALADQDIAAAGGQ